MKIRDYIRALRDSIAELENCKRFLSDEAKIAEIDTTIEQGRTRMQDMQPALDEWNNRVADHPSIWNSDGTSKSRPGWPNDPGQMIP